MSHYFLFDPLTSIMLVIVTFISFLVNFYSVSYLSSDPFICRFFSYLNLFSFYVNSRYCGELFTNVSWLGGSWSCFIFTYNFWFTRLNANKSAIKAMVLIV